MPIASQIRAEIEATLARRIPSALTPLPRVFRPTASTGIRELDELTGGGLPIGAISEIVGLECSGRTSLSLAFLAQITRQGKVCAWIDVSDTLHPESAAAAGVDLDRLLWVRCGGPAAPAAVQSDDFKLDDCRTIVEIPETKRVQLGGNSPHPRSESIGLPLAIGDLLGVKAKYRRDKGVGTPGAPNRPLSKISSPKGSETSRVEQVASDRLPARRGAYVLEQREAYEPLCAEALHKPRPQTKVFEATGSGGEFKRHASSLQSTSWQRLDQALRVSDLLLQAGGFSAIVLDMGSIVPEFASRVPLATWFRYRAAAERTQSSFLLLTQYSCAKSSAGAVLHLDAAQHESVGTTIFAGLTNRVAFTRRRFEQDAKKVVPIRKPPQRADGAEWSSRTAWARERG